MHPIPTATDPHFALSTNRPAQRFCRPCSPHNPTEVRLRYLRGHPNNQYRDTNFRSFDRKGASPVQPPSAAPYSAFSCKKPCFDPTYDTENPAVRMKERSYPHLCPSPNRAIRTHPLPFETLVEPTRLSAVPPDTSPLFAATTTPKATDNPGSGLPRRTGAKTSNDPSFANPTFQPQEPF